MRLLFLAACAWVVYRVVLENSEDGDKQELLAAANKTKRKVKRAVM